MIDLGEGRNDWMSYLDLEYTYELPGSMWLSFQSHPSACPQPPLAPDPALLPWWVLLPTKVEAAIAKPPCMEDRSVYISMCTSSKRVHIEGDGVLLDLTCLWPGWTYPLPADDLLHTLRKDPDSSQNACPCSHSWKGASQLHSKLPLLRHTSIIVHTWTRWRRDSL